MGHKLSRRKVYLCVVARMLTDMLGSRTLFTVWCTIRAGKRCACSPVHTQSQSMHCEVAGMT